MSVAVTVGITAALCVLIVISGFFSAAETAFTSFSRARMKALAKSNRNAQRVLEMSEDYNSVLTTLLIGNNIVNILATSLAATLFVAHFGDLGVTLSTVVMTVLVLIVGEVSPKTIAKERPEFCAMVACRIIYACSVIFKPFVALFDLWKRFLYRLFGLNAKRPKMTAEEFDIIVSDIAGEGVIPRDEEQLIKNAIKFDNTRVSAVMTTVENVTYVAVNAQIAEVKRMFEQSNYSRVPVLYPDGTVAGILYRADFYETLLAGGENFLFAIRPAFYCSPDDGIARLLDNMKRSSQHLAIVTDGHKFCGLITVEDILKELVGEINDRYDAVPNQGLPRVRESL